MQQEIIEIGKSWARHIHWYQQSSPFISFQEFTKVL